MAEHTAVAEPIAESPGRARGFHQANRFNQKPEWLLMKVFSADTFRLPQPVA
jgi:hypothetical protein